MLKKIRIALYDKNGYMQSLVEYLCQKSQYAIETRLFTTLDTLIQSAEKKTIDVLLAGEEVVEEIALLKNKLSQIILLTEGNIVSEQSEYYMVFKYQSAPDIIREVLAQVAENDAISYTDHKILKEAGEIIAVYSPYGGAGVTNYSFCLARELSKKYCALYVNLELFHGLSYCMQDKKGRSMESFRGMSEVIFYLKQKKEKLAIKLESIAVSVQGVDCILTVEDYRDLQHMTKEDMEELLQVLLFQSKYDKVIFDIGYMGEAILCLLEKAHRIYMPEVETDIQKSKESSFERLLIRENLEEVLHKREHIKMKGGDRMAL